MAFTTQIIFPIYDGDGDPWKCWFVCEAFLEDNIVVGENWQISMFIGGIQDRALSWYMNFIKNGAKTKKEIKNNFCELFQMHENRHLDAHNLKSLTQELEKLFMNIMKDSKTSSIRCQPR